MVQTLLFCWTAFGQDFFTNRLQQFAESSIGAVHDMYDFHVYFYILSEIILYTIYSAAFYYTLSEINLYKLYSAAFEILELILNV